MGWPRSRIVDERRPGCYHLISRCVRRAFLCGAGAEHRRGWIEGALRRQAAIFAIDTLAYAVMNNHFHVVVHTDPERAAAWDAAEVTRRWGLLFPHEDDGGDAESGWSAERIARFAADEEWVTERRQRLASMSWYMRILKQRIARRANREDGVTGHFWEGRFKSVPLLDHAAVLACMVYVDLNPIRAGIADTPEDSAYTAICQRISRRHVKEQTDTMGSRSDHIKQCASAGDQTRDEPQQASAAAAPPDAHHQHPTIGCLANDRTPATPPSQAPSNDASWLCPINDEHPSAGRHSISSLLGCSLTHDGYLRLVDRTGRLIAHGKTGAIPRDCAAILDRLSIDIDDWHNDMTRSGSFTTTVVGAAKKVRQFAQTIGARWLKSPTKSTAAS